ncbi:alginate O-acetyltransferase AlgF [Vibrio sp. 404]|uniref:Alginate biosynthesis protein AlgF n=1 Tax=Vibrio marinisediminis TaxID=2758441 RepID=A0A7W2IV99_9VIBR|nr:alginate O-acetyltransferase AlgF [Vibrio marinisediminis]MBA5764365.1 alginate O-acetyltransferase AlgF [Vibrio marinisediminis]
MNFVKNALICLSSMLLAFATNANDEALYDKKPSKDSSFVRLINIENHTRTMHADGIKVFTSNPREITNYVPIDSGTYNFSVGGNSINVTIPNKTKLSFFVVGNDLKYIVQDRNADNRSAKISLFNLSETPLTLGAGKSNKTVLEKVETNSFKSRSVNPMKIAFNVNTDKNILLPTPQLILKRGINSEVIIYDGLMGKELIIAESEW